MDDVLSSSSLEKYGVLPFPFKIVKIVLAMIKVTQNSHHELELILNFPEQFLYLSTAKKVFYSGERLTKRNTDRPASTHRNFFLCLLFVTFNLRMQVSRICYMLACLSIVPLPPS